MDERPNRRLVLGTMGGMASATSLAQTANRPKTRSDPGSGDMVSITRFGAVADGRTDNTAAIKAAIAHGVATGRPIFVPAARAGYCIASTIEPLTGIVGEGRESILQAMKGSFADGSAMVRIGSEEDAGHFPCTVPVMGFRLIGGADRSIRRTSDPRSIGFSGSGLVYAGTATAIHAIDVTVERCMKGIVHANNRGHLGGTNIQCSSNWYNLWWERNTGDYRYFDCVFTGALFATYGCHGSDRGGVDFGGISGLTMIGCHGGFSPYVVFQEDGDGTVGITGWTAINSSNEQVGNQVVRLGRTLPGKRRVSREWNLVSVGHTWTQKGSEEHQAYAILDPARAPQQEYAIDLDMVQGQSIEIAGSSWILGSSGRHTRIRDLLTWVRDAGGIGGYEIIGQGRERLVYSSIPALRIVQSVKTALGGPRPATLVDAAIPPSYDNTPFAEVEWSLAFDNAGGTAVTAVMVAVVQGLENAAPQSSHMLHLTSGRGNLSGFFRIAIGQRDRRANRHQVAILCRTDVRHDVTIEGSIAITLSQNVGVVG